MVENFLIPFFFTIFFEIIKWCKKQTAEIHAARFTKNQEAQFGGGGQCFFEGTNWEKFDLIFWIILFEFWLILFVSAAFFIILVEKFPFFSYLFFSEWFCWSFWCGFYKEWLSGPIFVVCIFGEYFFQLVTLGRF